MNYEGARVKYKTLEPEEFFDVNTYVAHPWLFQDAMTHERLNANSKDVFQPTAWYEVRSSNSNSLHQAILNYQILLCFSNIFQNYVVEESNPKTFNLKELLSTLLLLSTPSNILLCMPLKRKLKITTMFIS
jgi:hypothetical protein